MAMAMVEQAQVQELGSVPELVLGSVALVQELVDIWEEEWVVMAMAMVE